MRGVDERGLLHSYVDLRVLMALLNSIYICITTEICAISLVATSTHQLVTYGLHSHAHIQFLSGVRSSYLYNKPSRTYYNTLMLLVRSGTWECLRAQPLWQTKWHSLRMVALRCAAWVGTLTRMNDFTHLVFRQMSRVHI